LAEGANGISPSNATSNDIASMTKFEISIAIAQIQRQSSITRIQGLDNGIIQMIGKEHKASGGRRHCIVNHSIQNLIGRHGTKIGQTVALIHREASVEP
jgi:hypothetical protein